MTKENPPLVLLGWMVGLPQVQEKPKTREVIGSNLKELGKAGIEKTGEVSLKLVAPVPTDASVLGQVLEIVKANPWIFIGALVIDIVTCICICCCCCIILCRGKA